MWLAACHILRLYVQLVSAPASVTQKSSACMGNLNLCFSMNGQSGIYEYILMCKPPMFWPKSSVISISLEAGDLWIEPGDRFSTVDQWVFYLLGWITRHFVRSGDFQTSLCAWAVAYSHFILSPISFTFMFGKTGSTNAWMSQVAKVVSCTCALWPLL